MNESEERCIEGERKKGVERLQAKMEGVGAMKGVGGRTEGGYQCRKESAKAKAVKERGREGKKWKEMRERMKSWTDESEPRVGCRSGWNGLSHSRRPEKRQMLVQGINNEFSKAGVFGAKVVMKGKEDEVKDM